MNDRGKETIDMRATSFSAIESYGPRWLGANVVSMNGHVIYPPPWRWWWIVPRLTVLLRITCYLQLRGGSWSASFRAALAHVRRMRAEVEEAKGKDDAAPAAKWMN